jgi:RNA recognition motif-containing protein
LYVNIFVGNLAFSATDDHLRQLFESHGVVDKVNIITDRDTGRSKGFGFVEMPDSAAAKAAIQGLNGKELDGRALTVNEAKPREPRREPSRSRW